MVDSDDTEELSELIRLAWSVGLVLLKAKIDGKNVYSVVNLAEAVEIMKEEPNIKMCVPDEIINRHRN